MSLMKLSIEVRNPLFKITYHCLTKMCLALIATSNNQRKRVGFGHLRYFASDCFDSFFASLSFPTLAKIHITGLVLIFKLCVLQNQNKPRDEQLKGKKIAWKIWG